jgi:hypothetical protein
MTELPNWTGPNAPDVDTLPQLSTLEGFDAMRVFIKSYWERDLKASDDLRQLLGAINRETKILPDGGLGDLAQWHDWLTAVDRVKAASSK